MEIKLNGKPIPTRKMIGHASIGDVIVSFDFEVLANADDDDILSSMIEAFLEKINMNFEEVE